MSRILVNESRNWLQVVTHVPAPKAQCKGGTNCTECSPMTQQCTKCAYDNGLDSKQQCEERTNHYVRYITVHLHKPAQAPLRHRSLPPCQPTDFLVICMPQAARAPQVWTCFNSACIDCQKDYR